MTDRAAGLPTAFVGDAHLLPDDDATKAFLAFLETAPRRFARLVLVGDIFDVWLARAHLHEAHHRQVLAALGRVAAAGLAVDYVVGNRDFGVETLPHAPFHRIAAEVLAAPAEGPEPPSWLAEHGDLVNVADRRYRAWRRVSRSRPVLGSVLRLPAVLGLPLSRWVEGRLRTTNLAYKRRVPTEAILQRAREHFAATGSRHLVLGHFHQELRLEAGSGSVLVVPDWKRSRRHAEWIPGPTGGSMRFADSLG